MEAVTALAFAFIMSQIHQCGRMQGVENLFLIQKQSDSECVADFESFPAEMKIFVLPTCNAKRIFEDIIDVKQKLQAMMHSVRWDQGTFTKATQCTKTSPECQ